MGYTLLADLQHQAVENVLKYYLDGDSLDSAISLWEAQYSGQPIEKLSFFVFEIATTSVLRNLRKEILHDLTIKLQSLTEDGAEQDSTIVIKNHHAKRPRYIPTSSSISTQNSILTTDEPELEKSTSKDVQAQPIVEIKVLAEFINSLYQGLKHIDQAELQEVFEEHLEEESIPQFIKQEIIDVAIYQAKLEMLPYDRQHIRKGTNIIYSVLCEYHGPSKTDRLMHQAISQLEQRYPLEDLRQFL